MQVYFVCMVKLYIPVLEVNDVDVLFMTACGCINVMSGSLQKRLLGGACTLDNALGLPSLFTS